MFGLFGGKKGKKAKNVSKKGVSHPAASPSRSSQHGDMFYDILKKISDLQDQVSRHDSRVYNRLEEHDDFLQNHHHEPMKNAAIEIMNKIYNQPGPVREEVVRIIKSDEDILRIIGENKMSAGEVAERMGLTREHVSRRISTLTKSGMLQRIQEGKRVFYVKPESDDVM